VIKPSFTTVATLLMMASLAPAAATEWSRTSRYGGQLSRSATIDGGIYSGSTTRTGPNGGTYMSTTSCTGGAPSRCSRSYSGTGPQGRSFSGMRASAHGPFRSRSVGSFTGPRGNTVLSFRQFRR
jgi:hypothetical protein